MMLKKGNIVECVSPIVKCLDPTIGGNIHITHEPIPNEVYEVDNCTAFLSFPCKNIFVSLKGIPNPIRVHKTTGQTELGWPIKMFKKRSDG